MGANESAWNLARFHLNPIDMLADVRVSHSDTNQSGRCLEHTFTAWHMGIVIGNMMPLVTA